MDFDKLTRKLEGIENASKNGFKVKDLHLTMRLDEIWYLAYSNIYSNQGAMTKGIDDITLDGFSTERIHQLINELKAKTYKPKPVRRAYIPKKDGKKRPLGVPSGDDKLVQMVVKILLEQIYEPVFHNISHGFRPNKSCHTALKQIKDVWTGTKWLIEFDIKGFFDNMNHDVMIHLLEKRINDKRFIGLIKTFLKAGYLEEWKYHRTYSGTPQGGIVSPILSNIYLHELDVFMKELITDFNIGKKRPVNPEYKEKGNRIYRLRKKMRKTGKTPEIIKELKALQKERKNLPSQLENTDEYKRLRYCRYADDFICGVIGSYKDAKEIKASIENFLMEKLLLQVSPEKTNITRLTRGIEFLGYNIRSHRGDKMVKVQVNGTTTTKRTTSHKIFLSVPREKVRNFCNKHGYGDITNSKITHRPHLAKSSEVEIISTYNAELRGLANYYHLAVDVKQKLNRLAYLSHYSLFKTIANKHKCHKSEIISSMKRGNGYYFRYKLNEEWKEIQIFQLKHMREIIECEDNLPITAHLFQSATELIQRLEAKKCEYCSRIDLPIESHHVRKLKDLASKPQLESWEKVMIARNRKTLILCLECHNLLHQGKLPDMRNIKIT